MLRLAASCLVRRSNVSATLRLPRCAVKAEGVLARSLSSSAIAEGRPRKYEGRTRYPQPQVTQSPRPKDVATDRLIDSANSIRADAELLDTIKITDDEVSQIYDSIMSPVERQSRDEQSLRHRSRAQFLDLRQQARARTLAKQLRQKPRQKNLPSPSESQRQGAEDDVKEDAVLEAVKQRTVSDKAMERLVYVDTRVVREMEKAKSAVLASTGPANVGELQEKVQALAAAKAQNDPNATTPDPGLIDASAAGQDLSSALVPDLSVGEFNYAIFANTLACNVDEAMRTFELMREAGIKPDQTTFANLTIVHAKAGDLETAVSMFKRLESEGLEPTVYSYGSLIRAYMEFNRVDDAFRVYEMMKAREVWPNLPVYNSLIVSCLKVGDFNRAWGVFEHLRYTIAQPDEISFSIMIHACAKQGQVEKAMNLFEEMVSSNLALSDVTFNSLIHACAVRVDYFDECFRLLELMEAHGFQPDFYTYNTVIYACARAKKLGLAREIFRDLLKRSMNPTQEDLLKIDAVTISNMMWAYAGFLPGVKNCSWKVAKRYEGMATKALETAKRPDDELAPTSTAPGPAPPNEERQFDAYYATVRLNELQEQAATLSHKLDNLKQEGASKEELDKHAVMLIDMLMPEDVPTVHNKIASEAVRLMRFYTDKLEGEVNTRLLNAYLTALVNNGRFDDAWLVIFRDFEKFGMPKDGWTFLRAIQLCARTRDVPSAWRVWDEYKRWRVEVEHELKTPGHERLKAGRTDVYGSNKPENELPAEEPHGDAAALNRVTQEMLALTVGLEFPGSNIMPANVAGGALAVTPEDREAARRVIGCDMKTEHATYIEMVTLLGSCGDFRAAIRLLREEKQAILEHQHNPTMQDVNSLYQNALSQGNKNDTLDIRGLCMQKPLHPARRALHRKWGTSFGWELTSPQHHSVSRRFPEEFKRHNPPFRNGEYVYSRTRKSQATNER